MKYVLLIFGLLFFSLGYSQTTNQTNIQIFHSFDDFEHLLKNNDDKVHIINFWATWCKPCVAELPYFELLNQASDSAGLEVVLVSLDFVNSIKKSLIPFIDKNNIKSRVVVLADEKTNSWISRVDEEWEGTIPGTLIYNKESYIFIEDSFETFEELESLINQFIK